MSEFEDRLRSQLRIEPGAPDEAFAGRVATRIDACERRRRIGLAVAAVIAVAMLAAMAAGVAMLGPVWAAIFPEAWIATPAQALSLLGVAIPTLGVLLLMVMIAPLVQSQR